MSTRDHILGWHHAAQLIADNMPVTVKPCPMRLVPVFEFDRTGIPDVDPVKAASLKKRAKEVEQAAFEIWLARVRPSGDVESVQQQWEDSSDYADLMEDLEEPGQAPAAALGDGWIDIGTETPDLQAGCYEWRNKTALVAYKAQRLSIRDLFNEADHGTYQYRLIPTEAA
jgi:hypothetical protein